MIKIILGSITMVLVGLVSAVFGFVIVVNLGFMFAPDFSYAGWRCYEATGPIGIPLGGLLGMFLTWKVIFGSRANF